MGQGTTVSLSHPSNIPGIALLMLALVWAFGSHLIPAQSAPIDEWIRLSLALADRVMLPLLADDSYWVVGHGVRYLSIQTMTGGDSWLRPPPRSIGGSARPNLGEDCSRHGMRAFATLNRACAQSPPSK